MRIPLVLAMCASCDVVFLEEPPPPPPPRTVEVSLLRQWAENGPDLAPVIAQELVDPTTLTARVAGGAPVEIARVATGVYAFETTDPTYALEVTGPSGSLTYHHTASVLKISERAVGRLPRREVTAPTPIQFNVIGPPSLFTLVHSTGLWTSTALPASSNLDWRAAASLWGPTGLLEADRHDAIYVVSYQDAAVGVGAVRRSMAGWDRQQLTMSDGTSHTHSATLTVAEQDLCIALTAERQRELVRLSTVAPGSFSTANVDWQIHATPAAQLGEVGAQFLSFDNARSDAPDPVVRFTNPFLGTTTLVSLGALASREIMAPGATVSTVAYYSTRIYAEPFVAGTTCTPVTLSAGQIGLPGTISIDGVALVADDAVIGHEDLEVSWSVTSEPVDLFTVVLFELVAEAGNSVSRPRHVAVTVENRATLRANLFTAGASYYLVVQSHRGLPHARDGDLATFEAPFGTAGASSGVFRIE